MITTLTHRANTISACIIHLCRAAATSRSLSGKVDQIVVSSWRRTHIYKRHARGKYIIASTSSFSPIPKHLFLRGYRNYITCRETFHTEKRDLLLHTLLVVHHRHCTQFCIYVCTHTWDRSMFTHTHTHESCCSIAARSLEVSAAPVYYRELRARAPLPIPTRERETLSAFFWQCSRASERKVRLLGEGWRPRWYIAVGDFHARFGYTNRAILSY